MYEAGDILIMPDGDELKVMFISEKGTITVLDIANKKLMSGPLKRLRKPKKVIKLLMS